ncbi:exodeoxyribonuclease III [Streptomonospora litoralis]|uniref:Exodeoxyribonuclease n=1 Tax=Streptomonospora litoralis TaxID=2498135 RepID=A0A4P6Q1E8_9ACTN|nr:exodeoxyribonuclease III [Streptomonospora litoralis]QBI54313.1 Exodeoxyribonuclease [Streptomonospora litoralis]
MSTTISTVNVNGLRAAARKGFLTWLDTTEADIICLQETRARHEQLPTTLTRHPRYHLLLAPADDDPGRAGVAIYTRTPPHTHRIGFDTPEFDNAGRYLEADIGDLTVASLYLPSGDVGTPRQDTKHRFMDAFLPYLAHRAHEAADRGRHLLLCGDLNIAHHPADLKNWRNNRNHSGFLDHERDWLTRLITDTGCTDVVRALHPDTHGPYSWWSYRGRAFDNDTGWRIDYHLATPHLAQRAEKAHVERAPTYDQRWSDHAPVTVTYTP